MEYKPATSSHWKANYPTGNGAARAGGPDHAAKNKKSLRYRRFANDFAYQELGNIWTDTSTGQYTEEKITVGADEGHRAVHPDDDRSRATWCLTQRAVRA